LKDIFNEATKQTEKMEKEFINKLQREFSVAYTNARKELSKMIEKMPDGKLSQAEMMKYDRLTKLISNIQDEVKRAESLQDYQLKTFLKDAYEINYYNTGYAVDKTLGIKTGFSAVDRKQVEAMINNPLLNVAIADNKARAQTEIARTLTQSVVNGEGIRDTARKLKDRIDVSLNRAERIARTETTKTMSKARTDGMARVERAGIKIQKEWVATLDGRTRDSHQSLDGKRVDVGEEFKPGLKNPGDGNDPAEVIFCRCTTTAYLPNYSEDRQDKYEYANYNDWKRKNGI
jgi:SPP1 gp7 family putative phage head morphogenesis protein